MRELLEIPIPPGGRIDTYSGVARRYGKLWTTCERPDGPKPTTAVLFVHPTSNFMGHYAQAPLAKRGVAVVGMATRYLANDSALIMENCVLDIAAVVRHLVQHEGYRTVVLAGNSGGGALAALYQSQAENPTLTSTPAGDPPDLTEAALPPVDGLLLMMAHPGRALVYTEWLDPAIVDEANPLLRDPGLDLFTRQPPFDADFLRRYREAQVARNRRITNTVLAWLAMAAGTDQSPYRDLAFVVHGTCADPRFVDLTVDPSDRVPGTQWGEPAVANHLPAGLGHHTSMRSWLSQWSYDLSECNALRHLPHVTVAVHVMYGTADMAAFPAHARAMFDAAPPKARTMTVLPGATHYFAGQEDLLETAADGVIGWLETEGLLR